MGCVSVMDHRQHLASVVPASRFACVWAEAGIRTRQILRAFRKRPDPYYEWLFVATPISCLAADGLYSDRGTCGWESSTVSCWRDGRRVKYRQPKSQLWKVTLPCKTGRWVVQTLRMWNAGNIWMLAASGKVHRNPWLRKERLKMTLGSMAISLQPLSAWDSRDMALNQDHAWASPREVEWWAWVPQCIRSIVLTQ